MGKKTDVDPGFARLASPARRALAGAGYTSLNQLAAVTEADVLKLHGMGPNAIRTLREAMKERGLAFREG